MEKNQLILVFALMEDSDGSRKREGADVEDGVLG